MNSLPPEVQPYALATVIMGVILLAALLRLWMLRRQEERLFKNKEAMEKQVVAQQREVMAIRADSAQWRAEMKREFDSFRAMASEQLKAEERRFDDLLKRSERRQVELQTALDVARQMCAELPAAKARVMHLEQALGIDGGEGHPPAGDGGDGGPGPGTAPRREWDVPPAGVLPEVPSVEEAKVAELERLVANARQQNTALQQALTTARLRSRVLTKAAGRSKQGK